MSGARFYVLPENISGDRLFLVGEEARHAHLVCRYRAGDQIWAVDGRGREYLVLIEKAGSEVVEGQVIESKDGRSEPLSQIILAQSIPKGHRFDLVVEKATEIGVYVLIPMLTERSVVRSAGLGDRLARWQRIAISAMKQSGRTFLPQVTPIMTFEEVLGWDDDYELGLIAWEEAAADPIEDRMLRSPGKVLLLIGPEGGFTLQEVEKARNSGFRPISLGPRRLRTETAGIVALSLLLYRLGDL